MAQVDLIAKVGAVNSRSFPNSGTSFSNYGALISLSETQASALIYEGQLIPGCM